MATAVALSQDPYANHAVARAHLERITDNFRVATRVNGEAIMFGTVALTVLVASQAFALLMFSLGVVYGVGKLMLGAYLLSAVGGISSALVEYFCVMGCELNDVENKAHLFALDEHIVRLPVIAELRESSET